MLRELKYEAIFLSHTHTHTRTPHTHTHTHARTHERIHTHNISSSVPTNKETTERYRCRPVARMWGNPMFYIVYKIGEKHVKYFHLSVLSYKVYVV